jgi:hypothetical protein
MLERSRSRRGERKIDGADDFSGKLEEFYMYCNRALASLNLVNLIDDELFLLISDYIIIGVYLRSLT